MTVLSGTGQFSFHGEFLRFVPRPSKEAAMLGSDTKGMPEY